MKQLFTSLIVCLSVMAAMAETTQDGVVKKYGDFAKAEPISKVMMKKNTTKPLLVAGASATDGFTKLGAGTLYDKFFGGTANVDIYRSTSNSNYYRILSPYDGITSSGSNYVGSEYLDFVVLQPENKLGDTSITMSNLVYFWSFDTGMYNSSYGSNVLAFHPAVIFDDENDWTYNKVLSYQSDGNTPYQVQFAPIYFLENVSDSDNSMLWNCTQANGYITITFPTISNNILVQSIKLSQTSASLTAGNTLQLSATVLPTNATNKTVSWTTSNSSVATVSSTGLVTAKAAGTATITCSATDGSGVKAACNVTVTNPNILVQTITLSQTSASLTAGNTLQLSATVLPTNATNKTVSWTTSNSSVATVSSSGLVTAKTVSTSTTVTITCSATDGSGVKATCSVTVKPSTILVESITLNQTSATLTTESPNNTLQLTATVLPTNATNKTVSWTTSNSGVATVSSTGLVTAVAEGTATITCTANDGSGVKATCAVTVTKSDPDIYIQSVVCTNDNPAQISKDDKVKFSATFWNNGAAGYVYTWPVLCTVTGSNNNIDEIIVDGDLSRDYFNASASKTVNYELGVDTIQPGTYYATVLYYDMAVEKWYYNGSAMAEVTVTAPGPIYPELSLSSVTCEKTALTQNDELKMTATFYNYGATGNARTVITVMAKDEDLTIVSVGDFVTSYFPASQSMTLSYSLPLADVPEGEYYASVLFYQESDDEDEAGWYYNSKCLIEIIVADDCNLKGDVNGDCIVNGTDLVALTNIILGRSDNRPAADVNGDGSVNGTDYVVLANIILGRSNARGMARTTVVGDFAGTSWIEVEPYEISAGQEKEVTIDLFNPDDEITLVQFDLDLPQGLSLKVAGGDYDIDIAGRTTWKNHSLSANATDGIIRFLLASSNNKALSGTEGAIIKMTLVADESYKGEGIALKNILLVTPEEKETKPEDIIPVGIRDIAVSTEQSRAPMYSISGQRIDAPRKGINILKGKKIVVR